MRLSSQATRAAAKRLKDELRVGIHDRDIREVYAGEQSRRVRRTNPRVVAVHR